MFIADQNICELCGFVPCQNILIQYVMFIIKVSCTFFV